MRGAPLAILAVGLLAASASTPAFATTTAADTPDVRCLMVLQAVAKDPKQREAAARGVYYYSGRLSARGTLARLDALMVAEGRKMNTPAIIQTELARCGGELSQRTGDLQALSARLQKQFGPPPAANDLPTAEK